MQRLGVRRFTLPDHDDCAGHLFTDTCVEGVEDLSKGIRIFTPSQSLPSARTGMLTAFEPVTRRFEAGFPIAPQFLAHPVDIVFKKDVAVSLRD